MDEKKMGKGRKGRGRERGRDEDKEEGERVSAVKKRWWWVGNKGERGGEGKRDGN